MTAPAASFDDLLNAAGGLQSLPDPMRLVFESMKARIARKDAALCAALPALIRLGDFVGHFDKGGPSGQGPIYRSSVVLQMLDALDPADWL